ncbi:hypothetical protein PRK78_002365 [Emydomyces testavorans]|uniref:Uncharacterized protein n=1 Tax=Emydomyces testavorans TaxID=2070801 RepID=A0AAF0IHI4_9EURO|nr:hypothetical protein PRK78_002365 [Emydomyces testavorans]
MAFSNFRNGDTRCPSSRDGSVQRQFTPPTEHGGQFCPLDADPTKAYTKNGIKVLPQPTADPLDPLNWKKWEKNVILGIVMLKYTTFYDSFNE